MLPHPHVADRGVALPPPRVTHRYAMAAARLGNASLAASILADPDSLWTDKFMPNGHYGNAFLPVYTPANGALLTAVAFLHPWFVCCTVFTLA